MADDDSKDSPLDRVGRYLAEMDLHDHLQGQVPRGRQYTDLVDSVNGEELKRSDLLDIVTKLKQAYGELAIGQGSGLMDEAWHQGFDAAEEWCLPGDAEMGRPKPKSPYRPAE